MNFLSKIVSPSAPRLSILVGLALSAFALMPSGAVAQAVPVIAIPGQAGLEEQGYVAEVLEFRAPLTQFEDCLTSVNESNILVTLIDLYDLTGTLVGSNLLSSIRNGTQFASVGSRLLITTQPLGPATCEGQSVYYYDFVELPAVVDTDGDGVPDGDDACPNSILGATVIIGNIDSGVPNPVDEFGCSLADRIQEIADGSGTHGAFVAGVTKLANDLKRAGVISGSQGGALTRAAARG